MRTDFTQEEARQFLEPLAEDNDVVRLVNPMTRRVEDVQAGESACAVCHQLWGRCQRCENCTSLRALRTKGQAYKMEILNGRTYWVYSRFMNIDGRGFVAEIAKDVTHHFIMDSDQQDEIGHLITSYNQMLITDSLTGVYNRRFLDEHFLPSLQCCHDENITVNLAFLDMDDFKLVNDRYGHNAGDRLLRDVAGFWQLHFHSREKGKERFVVRFGGDEIMIIACGITQARFEDEIRRHYAEMRRTCYCSDALHFTFDFTFGLASTETLGPGWTWEQLIELADHRMYAVKSARKGGQEKSGQ